MTLFGFQPLITKEIANSASKQIFYDNTKIKNFLNYQFIPIKKSVADIGKIFIDRLLFHLLYSYLYHFNSCIGFDGQKGNNENCFSFCSLPYGIDADAGY